MRESRWPRIILCGLIAGTVWTLLSVVLVSAVGADFFAAIAERSGHNEATSSGLPLYLLSVAAGVWAIWLYALIRPQFASNVGAAIATALSWWTIASLQSLKWVFVLGIPATNWLPLTSNALATVIATIVGAWLFASVQTRSPSSVAHSG